jgi:6-pyruvoyltetrahydropterin/6-carboxytetrahydropterin synthase
MRTSLTRRVTFSATHRYRVAAWTAGENDAAFGEWAQPHLHSYTCDVTVTGKPDPLTGFVVDLRVLDAALTNEVVRRFDGRDIDEDVSEFARGAIVSSCENLARFISDRIQSCLGSVRVVRVTVAEDSTLSATHEPGDDV